MNKSNNKCIKTNIEFRLRLSHCISAPFNVENCKKQVKVHS